MSNATLLNLFCPWLVILGGPCWLWALSFGCGLYLLFVGLCLLVVGLTFCLWAFAFGCGLYPLDCGLSFIFMGYVYCHMLKLLI